VCNERYTIAIELVTTASCVYLVGAGPGDPGLLTVKALELIQSADVVVYDRLVSNEVLNLIPRSVARVYVGKKAGRHLIPQDEINALLVRLAGNHQKVVRLKGGDPFLFGRGGEEALYLTRHGVSFEVVPGVTSASACSSYAGIPLTHRGMARGVQFITGHCRADEPLDLDWKSLATPDITLAVYMGLVNVEEIASRLIDAGRSPATPVAIIENGTTTRQRQIHTTLVELPTVVDQETVQPPAMMVIGRVTSLAQELSWFQIADEPAIKQAN
jgi:uroporphyrin-III C-methyltransferase/precorrin-2 dehydrogenase/sirohydrochlorin ferrochelatase/uroporphyrin-III C-methyltransferase